MGRRLVRVTSLIIVVYAVCCSSLRLLRVLIPPYAVRGRSVELMCDFDSERSPLYSVKWFKDDEEFFRYVPAAKKQYRYQVFTPAGLTVDNTSSKASRVILKDLNFDASGNYRCEVSTEGPEFSTVIGQGGLLVVEPLSSDPKLTGGRRKYVVNDTVDLMCTSSPSRPAAHLTWVINGQNPPREQVVDVGLRQQPDGLMVRTSRIRFITTPSHFVDGRLSIKCIASLSRPSTTMKNSKNRDLNGNVEDLLPNQLLAHFFNKWENTLEVSSVPKVTLDQSLILMWSLFVVQLLLNPLWALLPGSLEENLLKLWLNYSRTGTKETNIPEYKNHQFTKNKTNYLNNSSALQLYSYVPNMITNNESHLCTEVLRSSLRNVA